MSDSDHSDSPTPADLLAHFCGEQFGWGIPVALDGWAKAAQALLDELAAAGWEVTHSETRQLEANVVEAAWGLLVEQQAASSPGWSMAKSWAFDKLREAFDALAAARSGERGDTEPEACKAFHPDWACAFTRGHDGRHSWDTSVWPTEPEATDG